MKKRILVLIFVAILSYIGYGTTVRSSSARASDTRVVTVHVDGRDKIIATNAHTVKRVVEALESPLGPHDKTEPALDTELGNGDFTINVYRARQIAVVDGANSYTITTAERTPKLIAKQAGFTTGPEDQYAFVRSNDPFTDAPGTELTIKRAKTINLDLYGTTSAIKTNESTVAEFLQSKGITLDPGDELNVPKESRIVQGMTVGIAQVSRNTETVEEVAAFEEQQIKDAQQPTTYRKIQTPGVNGKKLVTYEIVSRNGAAPERNPIKEVITVAPVTQVAVVGSRTNMPYTGGGSKSDWMRAAGIPESEWGYADYIISKESGWNPNATNARSGACGLAQALPCSKVPGNPLDPVDSLRWANGYVNGRYGGWSGAVAHSKQTGWY